MAIALQGTPTLYESASSVSAVISYPTGVTNGEVLVCSLAISQQTAHTTAPAGWTLAKSQDTVSSTSYPAMSVFYRIADGTESGTVTFGSWATTGRVTAVMSRWSGVNTTTPLDATSVSANSAVSTTFTMPSISTVTNDSVLVHSIGLNAGSAADIDTLAGTTLVTKATGTGRRMGQWYEQRPTAGASGTRTWTENPTTTALQWTGVTIALRSSGAAIQPSLIQRIVGVPASNPGTTAVVQAKVANATSVRLKLSTDAAGTQGVVYGSAVTPSGNGDVRLTASGLTANTRYYYRVAMTGSGPELLDSEGTIGRLKTAPVGASSFSFCFGSCFSGVNTDAVDRMAARGDDMFLLLGDLYYSDGTSATTANFRDKMNEKISAYQALLATANTIYTPSDHDGFNNNSTAGNDPTAWTNWNTVRSELWPNTSTYYTYVWGRVRFIVTDDRSFKSNPAATDNGSKTAFGATQKQWIKDTITAATEPVIVIAQSSPWIGAAETADDGWFGFTTERTELANFYAASGKKIVIIAGDMHALAADNGTNSPGGVPVFQAAPFNQTSSIKGGPYSVSPYPAAAGQGVTQYGRVVVSDTGSQIVLTFSGYSASTDTQRVTMSVTQVTSDPTQYVPAVFVNTPTGWVQCKIAVL